MKKIILFTLALVCIGYSSQACKGRCTLSANCSGILPQVNKNILGIRYLNNAFRVNTPTTGDVPAETGQQKHFSNTAELWGRFIPLKGVFILVHVPYRHTGYTVGNSTNRSNGPGDASVQANYAFVNAADSLRNINQVLRLGAGIKLPTGKSRSETGIPASMLPGTGSLDYQLTGNYIIRHQHIGLNSDVTYTFSTENNHKYKFGNKLAAASNIFYWQNVGNLALLPSAGIYYEHAACDEVKSVDNSRTGGQSVYTNLALNVYSDHMLLGATWQQNLSTTTVRATRNNYRTNISLAYIF